MSVFQTTAIIQARIGSTRLPGKVLMDLCGYSVLEWVVRRTKMADSIAQVALAIPDTPENDDLEHEGLSLGVRVVRGSEDDVLARYWRTAVRVGALTVARITADCPFIDPGVIDRVASACMPDRHRLCYASNVIQRTMPDGLDCEAFTFNTLMAAQAHAAPDEREHVTTWMRHSDKVHRIHVTDDIDRSQIRWTLDTREDLDALRRLADGFTPDTLTTEALLERHAALSR